MEEEYNAALPADLLRLPPFPLIGLHGLAELHPTVSTCMTLVRTADLDSLPVVTHKPKHTSYDTVRPSGVIKANWLRKHLIEMPAAVATLVQVRIDQIRGSKNLINQIA
jgi:hypothetical protein